MATLYAFRVRVSSQSADCVVPQRVNPLQTNLWTVIKRSNRVCVMKTQFDSQIRVVSLENLKAMCERVSGVCHRYAVSKIGPTRVRVAYSNPDEYANESPIEAEFPCYPSDFDGQDNPSVVLHMVRLIVARGDTKAWQSFQPLLDCPQLWRTPHYGADKWQTAKECKTVSVA